VTTPDAVEDIIALVKIDRTSPVPLYFQVAGELQRLVDTNALPPGSRLVNEIAMADRLGVSRPTMRQAIQYLVDRGLVVRKRGVGTQVVRSHLRRSLELSSLFDDLKREGRKPSTTVLSLGLAEADAEVAAALEVEPGSKVTKLERLRFADDEPIALMTNYLPIGRFDLDKAALVRGGLYDAIRMAGVRVRVADQTIGAVGATAQHAKLLGERKGAALLTMRRIAYDDEGQVIEYGTHIYRSSRYSFSLSLVGR
jgi:DNA-binding GntR family transcriptional regulator